MTAALFGRNRFVNVDSDGYFVFQTQKKAHKHPHRNTPWRVDEEGLVRETCYHTRKVHALMALFSRETTR